MTQAHTNCCWCGRTCLPCGEDVARLVNAAPALLNALQRLVHPMADDSDVEYAAQVIAAATGK